MRTFVCSYPEAQECTFRSHDRDCKNGHARVVFRKGIRGGTGREQWQARSHGTLVVPLEFKGSNGPAPIGFVPIVDGELWDVCFVFQIPSSYQEIWAVELFRCVSRPTPKPEQLEALKERFDRPKAPKAEPVKAAPRRPGPYVPRKPGEPVGVNLVLA